MRKYLFLATATALFFSLVWFDSTLYAQEKLRYSCSAQVYEAFEKERLAIFTKATGIPVDLFIASSSSSVNRLMYGYSDVASTARGLFYPLKESGYLETPFCRDPLAVIVNGSSALNGITEEQLVRIFSGDAQNWKAVGGADEPILVVIPAKNTAAFENFERMAMKKKDIRYDLMAYQSTLVVDVVKRFPSAVSFIASGAVANAEGVKVLKVNGLGPKERGYPYYQEFYFVTKGKPEGAAKTFIDFALSEKGRAIIDKRGMIPVKP
jgi:phosphate transport system substrate-binding protein